jgi:hypothetical protein
MIGGGISEEPYLIQRYRCTEEADTKAIRQSAISRRNTKIRGNTIFDHSPSKEPPSYKHGNRSRGSLENDAQGKNSCVENLEAGLEAKREVMS